MPSVPRTWPQRAAALLLAAWLPVAAAEEVVGTLGAVGSDTLAGLMLRWGERLAERHPGVRLQFQAGGSASAPPALAAGTTRLGPMSRPMSEAERSDFTARHGYPPTAVEIARDALVVVVHRHNPLEALGLETLDAIFSDTRRCGGGRDITRWDQLGLEHPAGRIDLQGRNAASGTHGLFRRRALCGGDFRVRLDEHPGSAAVVAAVAASTTAMGYAGLNHLTSSVKALALRDGEGRRVAPGPDSVRDGDYPLARTLYLYLNRDPEAPLPDPERAFLAYILSEAGQAIVAELGFVRLPATALADERRKLGLDEAP